MKKIFIGALSVVAGLMLATNASAQTVGSFGLSPNSDGGIDFNWSTSGGDVVTLAATCNPSITISTHEDDFQCGDVGERAMLSTGTYHLHFRNTSSNSTDVTMVLSVVKNSMRVDTRTISVAVPPESTQPFRFTFPTNGATLVEGSSYNITWINDNSGGYGYTAYIGTGLDYNGNNLGNIIRTIGAVNSNPEFGWVVPLDLASRSDYRIELRGRGGGGGVSEPFSIVMPTIYPPTYTTPLAVPTPTPTPRPTPIYPSTDSQRQQMIIQLQQLLAQLIQQLIALLQQQSH